MYLIKIEQAVRNSLQVIQYLTAVNAVSITEVNMQSRPFTRPIIKVRPYLPIEYPFLKIITDSGNNMQQTISLKQPIILELLPVRKTVLTTITHQERIYQRRTAHTSYLCKIHCITTNQRITDLSPEFQILVLRFLFPEKSITPQEVVLIQFFFMGGQGNRTYLIEINRITLRSIRIATQGVRFR